MNKMTLFEAIGMLDADLVSESLSDPHGKGAARIKRSTAPEFSTSASEETLHLIVQKRRTAVGQLLKYAAAILIVIGLAAAAVLLLPRFTQQKQKPFSAAPGKGTEQQDSLPNEEANSARSAAERLLSQIRAKDLLGVDFAEFGTEKIEVRGWNVTKYGDWESRALLTVSFRVIGTTAEPDDDRKPDQIIDRQFTMLRYPMPDKSSSETESEKSEIVYWASGACWFCPDGEQAVWRLGSESCAAFDTGWMIFSMGETFSVTKPASGS